MAEMIDSSDNSPRVNNTTAARGQEPLPELLAACLVEIGPLMIRAETTFVSRDGDALTLRQFRMLRYLAQGCRTLSEIQRRGPAKLPTLSEVMDGLLERGLVNRTKDPEDGRRFLLALTDSGRERLTAAQRDLDELQERLRHVIASVEEPSVSNLNTALRTALLSWVESPDTMVEFVRIPEG